MIRFRRKQWVIASCAAAMLLASAVGSLLMAVQTRLIFVADDSVKALSEAYNSSGQDLFARLMASPGNVVFRISLGLPRFKARFDVSLKRHFQALGMTRPFDMAKADFSGMTGGQPGENAISIDEVSHRAVIDVTEEGTEATAATAVFMIASSPPQFRVTRPFLFYIVDDATDAILFQGRIVDPR